MKSTRRLFLLMGLSLVPLASTVAFAEAPKCDVCGMKIDHEHRYHFRYEVDGKKVAEIGSFTCANKYWSKNKGKKMSFLAMDFVTGKFSDPKKGFFLVNSKLKVGNGMDKASAVFFADKAKAEMAKKANGGQIVGLDAALKAAAR